jgi:hypothetical protein
MAASQKRPIPRPRPRPLGDEPLTEPATPEDSDPAPDNPHANTPSHPNARGTLPMARYLTYPAIEDEIPPNDPSSPTPQLLAPSLPP